MNGEGGLARIDGGGNTALDQSQPRGDAKRGEGICVIFGALRPPTKVMTGAAILLTPAVRIQAGKIMPPLTSPRAI